MAHYITTHDTNAKAVFSDRVPNDRVKLGDGFSMEILYATENHPVDVSTQSDIDQYAHYRMNGMGNRICTEHGTAAAMINMPPNSESPMHRTLTLDVDIVIEGIVELHLDSGEKRTMKAGDSIVQRAGMHKWVNVTPNDGWVKMVGFAQPIKEPLEIDGKKLETDFAMG